MLCQCSPFIESFFSVPTAAPDDVILSVKNASSISVQIFPLVDLYGENGVIRYYNISMEEFSTYEDINTFPASQFFHAAYIYGGDYDGFLVTQENSTNNAVKCNSSFGEIHNKTSQTRQVTIAKLRYYTFYQVSAAACTLVGCGPWKKAASVVRTKEFHPTCPPTNVSIKIESSTSLAVSWNHLEISCSNGIVTQYRFLFGEADSFLVVHPVEMAAWPVFNETIYQQKFHFLVTNDTINDFKSFTSLVFRFHRLKKFSTYCFQVNGFTVVGGGPYSNMTCARTLQDCK